MFGSQQACTEKAKLCSDGPSGRKKIQICSDWPQKMVISLSDGSIHPISIACPAPTVLASCYNSFDCIEDLQLCIIKGVRPS